MLRVGNERKIILILTVFTTFITIVSGENATCDEIQSSEFPEDIFTKTQRKCGAIILHVICAVYCFGAIAYVCSERFLPTISCICEDLKLSDDVAAATFMSIATSAPEFFSNIVGTFITESDIGVGHVIGNGFYNMFAVAALGGVAAKQEIVLEWWPLTRDCALYALVALVLTGIVWDGVVHISETVILLSLYFIYFIIMFNNKKIINFLRQKLDVEINVPNEKKVVDKNTDVNKDEKCLTKEKDLADSELMGSEEEITLPRPITLSVSKAENERWKMIKKIFLVPISFSVHYTIPNVRKTELRKYYPIAFIVCVAWIGVTTYIGTWMISVIGDTFGISDLVMGMVFMAAGGSVVEAYCVYWKVKKGECKIGLSNCLGCNTLDATLCLALPWFIKTLPLKIFHCNTGFWIVKLNSSAIHISCILLFISVIALLLIFYLNKFKLNKKLGFISGGLYIVVLFIAVSVESYSKTDSS